jgi:hypothetical protein
MKWEEQSYSSVGYAMNSLGKASNSSRVTLCDANIPGGQSGRYFSEFLSVFPY